MKKFLKNKLAAKLLVLALAISMVFALTGCLGLGVTVKVGTGYDGKPDIKIGYTDDVTNYGEGPYFGDDDFEWNYNWDNDEDGGNYSASSIEGTIPVEYKEYDSTEFMSLCQDLTDAAKGTDSALIIKIYDELTAEYDKAVTNYTVADLLHSKDTTDTYYSDRRVAEEDTVNNMNDAAMTAAHQVTLGPCADALKEHVGDSVYEQLEAYEPKTEQELAWDKRLSELATEYDGLAAAYGAGSEEFNEKAGKIYLEMVKIRTELAKSKGYDSYAQYSDAEEYCRGISEEDLKVFRDSVKQLAPNFYYLIYNTTAYFGFEYSYVDFTDEQLIDALKKYAGKISSNAAEAAEYMTENNLCDTGRDANRLDGCFATYLRTAQSPFIFVTSSGNRTFVSITHEFGHFTDFYLHGEGTGFATAPFILDVAEMASNGLQTLYTEYYDDIYGSDMSEYAITSNLIDLLMNLIDGCIYDEFQREVYAHPDWTIEQINNCYKSVAESYGDPYGSSDSTVWMQVNHNFSVPMYYVSYALSAYGVMQIWDTMQTDYSAACDQWNKVVETGSTVYTFPEMMEYMGMHGITEKQYIFNVVTRLNDFIDSHSYSLYE